MEIYLNNKQVLIGDNFLLGDFEPYWILFVNVRFCYNICHCNGFKGICNLQDTIYDNV